MDLDARILDVLAKADGYVSVDEVRDSLADCGVEELQAVMNQMLDNGLIDLSRQSVAVQRVRITGKGRLRLSAAHKAAQQYADDKRERRLDRKIAIAGVLVPTITFVLGLIVERLWAVTTIIVG